MVHHSTLHHYRSAPSLLLAHSQDCIHSVPHLLDQVRWLSPHHFQGPPEGHNQLQKWCAEQQTRVADYMATSTNGNGNSWCQDNGRPHRRDIEEECLWRLCIITVCCSLDVKWYRWITSGPSSVVQNIAGKEAWSVLRYVECSVVGSWYAKQQ